MISIIQITWKFFWNYLINFSSIKVDLPITASHNNAKLISISIQKHHPIDFQINPKLTTRRYYYCYTSSHTNKHFQGKGVTFRRSIW